MRALLVDTDVVSMIFKQDTRASRFERYLIGAQRAICFMTRAELSLWPRRADWGQVKIRRFERFLRDYVVLPYDDVLCDMWAEVKFNSQRQGRELTHADAWIAATALAYDLALVTHNVQHFAAVDGLQLIL